MDICLLLKIWVKILVKIRNFLIMLNNLGLKHLKTTANKVIKKTAKATGNLIGNKNADKLLKSRKICDRIIQKQLQMKMIKKYFR